MEVLLIVISPFRTMPMAALQKELPSLQSSWSMDLFSDCFLATGKVKCPVKSKTSLTEGNSLSIIHSAKGRGAFNLLKGGGA